LLYPALLYERTARSMASSPGAGAILTIREVADYLKVTERTIYRLAAAKQIPAFKVGGSWRFSRADIDSWINQQSMDGIESNKNNDGGKA
jgi:excisionase family DNA binding protein